MCGGRSAWATLTFSCHVGLRAVLVTAFTGDIKSECPSHEGGHSIAFYHLVQKSHSVLSTVRRVQKPTPFQGKVTQTLRPKEKTIKGWEDVFLNRCSLGGGIDGRRPKEFA